MPVIDENGRVKPLSDPPRTQVTMQSIADELGVSRTTVYRVIQGSSKVAPHTRKAIMDAIEHHDYHPNTVAQNLASRRAGAVVFCSDSVASSIWASLTDELVTYFNEQSYSVNIRIGQELAWRTVDKYLASDVRSRRIDGLIFKYGSPFLDADIFAETRRRIAEYRMPLVFLTRVGGRSDVDFVSTDRAAGAESLVEHLLARGRRHIVLATVPDDHGSSHVLGDDKQAGFVRAIASAPANSVKHGFWGLRGYDYTSGYTAGEQIAASRSMPDSILCPNDLTAIGVINGLIRRGVRVPDDVAVVGFNNDGYCDISPVPLTTVEQPTMEICREAYRLFCERLHDPEKPYEQVLFPPKLVIRDSA